MQPTLGVFDIFGPVMVGPSSSHTAGISRLGFMARQILGQVPTRIHVDLLGSVGINYLECNSHNAIISGMLGWKPDDLRLSKAIAEACQRGIKVDWQTLNTPVEHPNTVRIITGAADGTVVEMVGISTGGGKIRVVEINGHRVELAGKEQALLIITDSSGKQGALDLLKKKGLPLSGIQESVKSGEYLLVVNVREPLGENTLEKLRGLAGVALVSELKALDHNVVIDVGPVESIQKMAQAAEAGGISLAEVFLEREQKRLGLTRVELLAEMLGLVKVMRNSVEADLREGCLPLRDYPATMRLAWENHCARKATTLGIRWQKPS
jgi:L-serine dehydratase